ncbi:hypothetical protein URH17368_2955 [Alicyclobacillus hesperidum URH17-3-68]|nr:hypothetical protein URH17368_2955 [Alicyclobacillus hesperidum URH17-3-68]
MYIYRSMYDYFTKVQTKFFALTKMPYDLYKTIRESLQ